MQPKQVAHQNKFSAVISSTHTYSLSLGPMRAMVQKKGTNATVKYTEIILGSNTKVPLCRSSCHEKDVLMDDANNPM